MAQPTWQQITAAARLLGITYDVRHDYHWVEFHWYNEQEYMALCQLANAYDLFETGYMTDRPSSQHRKRGSIPVALNRFSGQFEE